MIGNAVLLAPTVTSCRGQARENEPISCADSGIEKLDQSVSRRKSETFLRDSRCEKVSITHVATLQRSGMCMCICVCEGPAVRLTGGHLRRPGEILAEKSRRIDI